MSFTDIFIRRPVLASVVSLLILLIGLASVFNLSVRQYPRITNTTITVTTAYPGANADLIKGFITTPIQQAVASAEGIDTLTSSSQQNYSVVTLNLRLDANPDRAVADVLSKIQQVKSVLPRESQDPIVVKQTGETTALMYLSFNSKVMTGSQITDYLTRVVQPRLQTINGVANAQILGGQTFAMRIWLNPDKMAALGVTPIDVRNALANNNFITAAGQVKGDFVQTTINAETALNNPGGLRQAGGGEPRRCADPARRYRHHRAGTGERQFLLRLRRVEGGLHRHLRHPDLQSAHRHRRRAQGLPRDPAAAAGRPGRGHRLRRHQVHQRLDQGGADNPARGGADRHRRDLPVPRQSALDLDPHRHHPAVAGRRDVRAAGARVFHQSVDAAGAGAGHRPRRRRCHRRGREHPPPHRGGHAALRCGAQGRARDRRAGDLHDHHAGGGLRADRLRLGPHRRAVPRVRLYAGRRRGRIRHRRPDAVADDGLQALEAARLGRPLQPLSRPHLRSLAAALPAPPQPHAERPADHAAHSGGSHGRNRNHVRHEPEGAGARGGPGHPVQYRQGAAGRQSRLSRAGDVRAQQGVRDRAREGARLHHQRSRQQRAPGHRRHPVQAVGGAEAHAEADPAEPAAQGGRHRRRPGDLLRAAVAAGLDRRAAGAVRDHHDRRLFPAGAGAGRGAGGSRQERPLHLHRQRPQVRDPADRAQARSRQGQPPRHHHAGHRRVARHAARRQLRQPLQSLRPQLPGHSPGAARFPPHRRLAARATRCAPPPARWCRCRASPRSSNRSSPTP